MPPFFHFGFELPEPESFDALRMRLVADGVPVVEERHEPNYVSVKCREPDGYIIEAAWQPRRSFFA